MPHERQRQEEERQRLAEEERQRLPEEERQRLAEEERQRLAEAQRQKQAEEERQKQAEGERQKQGEEERQEQAEEERQIQAAEERRRLVEKGRRLAKEGQRLIDEGGRLAEDERRQAEEERERLAEGRRRLAEKEREKQAEEKRQTEQELFEEDDIQETHTSRGRKYLVKAQPDRGSLASLWNLDRERPYRKKPKPPRGIGAAQRENDRKQITQINLVIDSADFAAPYSDQQADAQKVPINFKICERGTWRVERSLLVNPSKPLAVKEVKRLAIKYMRKHDGMQIYDINFRQLDPRTCFEDVTADGTNTILLIPDSERDVIEFPDAPRMHNESQAESAAGQPNLASNSQVEQEDGPGRKKGRLEIRAGHSNGSNNRG
ncbi:hypothetical protein K469DRAFT_761633 [Zopfia rhizophila CBS 207.26]|uniref:Uncharacterized protein n=1 Tax=Zopfia rhizophila CBS 207.26 TaxID=1314779 RepID=A0A6A6D994_9PEZI|nr:hypothetical protein K469DRAFT_761633 [Zopfia rhizophila CBS 207.26]